MDIEDVIEGLNFRSFQGALVQFLYVRSEDPVTAQEEWDHGMKYVLPMQHNIDNPIEADSDDTFVEYWIDDDDRMSQDYMKVVGGESVNETMKKADITIRFIGTSAEAWAKLFHHLTRRDEWVKVCVAYCNAASLEYIGPIRPINVDYFKGQNTSIAFDISLRMTYNEVLRLTAEQLQLLSIGGGIIVSNGR